MLALIVAGLVAGAAALVPVAAQAHCPLCTAGAGILAVAAASLGVNPMSVGVFVGAFAVALGLWAARFLKKRYVPFQSGILAVLSLLATVLPISPLIDSYTSIYVSLGGDYGSLLNRTYVISRFVAGSLMGGVLLAAAPAVSALAGKMIGRRVPYQGLVITFGMLIVSSLAVQFLL